MRQVAALSLLVLACAAPVASAEAPPTPNWPALLPATDTSTQQPGKVPGCAKVSIKCVDLVAKRLKKIRDGFGCDHRAVFATTYLELTRILRRTLVQEPRFFRQKGWIYRTAASFADFYYRATAASKTGAPVPGAWKVAYETARTGDANAAQDMLLGINAHVQRDMPYVIAGLGIRQSDGTSRKPDHDAGNEVLRRAYEPIVREVERRFDPVLGTINSPLTPADDVGGMELVKLWREGVWRNAERLLAAKTDVERAQVAQSIELQAETTARSIVAGSSQPGYRATRDEYCAAHQR